MQVPTSCMLVVQDSAITNQMVVGDSRVDPCPDGGLHDVKIMSRNYKVSLDRPYPSQVNQKLHVPFLDSETTTIRQATDHL